MGEGVKESKVSVFHLRNEDASSDNHDTEMVIFFYSSVFP